MHMVPECLVYQPAFFPLVIHDSQMGDDVARLPKFVEALAGRGVGLERLYRSFGDCGPIYPPMTMPPNSAIDGDTVRSPLRAPHGARHRER
jgi:hypothetical protein